ATRRIQNYVAPHENVSRTSSGLAYIRVIKVLVRDLGAKGYWPNAPIDSFTTSISYCHHPPLNPLKGTFASGQP
ncbi:MAG TPA: hypothetical protein VFN95_08175, partial [Flavitalea sp.]|nr:hypothetical protein [Flavitalea sp.]